IRAFIKTLLRYDPESGNLEEGILGFTKAYYGCVEAQGRGTLHCHMVVWVEGGLNPSQLQKRLQQDDPEFGTRLVSFLDDILSTSVPDEVGSDPPDRSQSRPQEPDLRRLVLKCQVHTHSGTCYKYCADGEPKVCRFDLDPDNVVPATTIDPATGIVTLRQLDGLVNKYNSTILQAMRCNMDIKPVGSGEDAKSIVYYITDYITKTQLKTHVAYAALQLAVNKVHSDPRVNGPDIDLSLRAKRMLQRCAFSLTANQELSAPQVISYLLDFGDKYTSHKFKNLYWTSFERHVMSEMADDPTALPAHMPLEDSDGDEEMEDSDDNDGNAADGEEDADDDDEFSSGELLQPDEVSIGQTSDGNIVELSSQLADYVLRGDGLEHICLWDYVSQVDK
ncbi:hypothetical protein K466DRAFT_441947, partial [Polyporus arcularius HHB13444]